MNRRTFLATTLAAALLAAVPLAGPALAIKKVEPDPRAVELCSQLLTALAIEDDAERQAAVAPLVHKSLLDKAGKLKSDIVRYSFKKASQSVKFYTNPASIFEVHEGNPMTVGFKETAERGRRDKYFVNKADGQPGRPAPIIVFIPEAEGGEPKVIDFGSL